MHISFHPSNAAATSLVERPENTGVAGRKSTESYGSLAQQVLQSQRQVAARGDLQGVPRSQRGAEGFRLRDLEVDGTGTRAPGQQGSDLPDCRVDETCPR